MKAVISGIEYVGIPPLGIQGLKTKLNTTIRVSFKTDIDQLWISSSSSTQKVCGSPDFPVTEALVGFRLYHWDEDLANQGPRGLSV
jgi:hypothetical protein